VKIERPRVTALSFSDAENSRFPFASKDKDAVGIRAKVGRQESGLAARMIVISSVIVS
jgi:hypothetical protein